MERARAAAVLAVAIAAVVPTLVARPIGAPAAADATTTSAAQLPTTSEPQLPTTSEPPTIVPPETTTTAEPATTTTTKPSTPRTTRASTATTRAGATTTVAATTRTTRAAAPAPPAPPANAGPAAAAADQVLAGAGKIAGSGITPPLVDVNNVLADLPQMRSNGLNAAAVDVFWTIDGETSSTIHPGPSTHSDTDLERIIATARRNDMRVIFTPKLVCPTCKRSTWRGILNPKDKAAFFAAYGDMVEHYAALAERTGVWLYFVGSEYNRIQDQPSRWRAVAARARKAFHGLTGYEVNWDVWNQVRYWDAIDVVGVSAYFPLTETTKPTVAELMAGWRKSTQKKFKGQTWVADLRELASETGKPIVFGELGYPAMTRPAREPWEPTPKSDKPYPEGQATAFEAALRTFDREPWWLGAVWWEWLDVSSYSFKGRPAQAFLAKWYVDNIRPGAGQPALPDPPPKAYTPPAIVVGASRRFRVLSALALLLALAPWSGWMLVAMARVQARDRARRRQARLGAGQAAIGAAGARAGATLVDGRHTPRR